MRHLRTAFAPAAIVCVLGVCAASASASEFESSGGPTKGLSVTKNEEFNVYPMTVVCPKALTKGSVAAGKPETFTNEVKYTSCTTFGSLKVNVTPGHFEYHADGTVALLEPITLTPALLRCHYEIPAQAGFLSESLLFSDVTTFVNPKKFPSGQMKIQVESKLKGMVYTAVGWPCTGPKNSPEVKEGKELEEEGEEGKYSGKIEEEVPGGNITWVK
jgi:hypothetical protein